MNKLACLIILIIFTKGNSMLYKILEDEKQLVEDYKNSLIELAKNHSGNYKINLVLSSANCSACDEVFNVLMEASTHTFVTVNYLQFEGDSNVKYIGYYKSISFLLEKVDKFYEHFAKLREQYTWNPRARHLIYLVEEPDEDELEMIFEEFWSCQVLNAAVIVRNRREAFTHNPYLNKPPKMWEEVVDWSKLFYDKLRNMNGRSIRARYIPFSTNNIVKWIEEENRYKLSGMEFGFAEAFFISVNATPVYLNMTNDKILLFKKFSYRYEIWSDRKFRGFELWFNAMPADIRFEDRAERSYPISVESLHILAPKSGVKIPSIFEPYDTVTWLIVLASLVAFAFYSYLFNKSRGIMDNAFFRTFGVFLGKNLAKRDHEPLEKFVFLILTMSSLLILSAYQGSLYGALATTSYYPEIETLYELSKVTKTVRTYQNIAEYLVADMKYGIKVFPFGMVDLHEYMRTHRSEAYAFPSMRSDFTVQSKSVSENGIPLYHVMKGYSLPEISTYILPYGSPYFEKLERVVFRCKEAGLHEYWNNMANFEALLSGTIIIFNPGEITLKKLSLQTQLMAFYIFAVGLSAGFCCFIGEIYFHTNNKKKSQALLSFVN